MALLSASAACIRLSIQHPLLSSSFLTSSPVLVKVPSDSSYPLALASATTRTRRPTLRSKCFVVNDEDSPEPVTQAEEEVELRENSETLLYSFSPLPLLYLAALLPGGTIIISVL